MTKVSSKPKFNPDILGSKILIVLGFSLPLSVAFNNLLVILLVLLWIYRGEYSKTLDLIKESKVLIAVLAFYILHIIGLLWTEDMSWGMHILRKEWILLLLPIMMSFVKKEHIRYYITAFLLAISLSELLSYLVWFELIPPILKATVYNPTVFIHHTSYNPFLAFAIYLTGYFILFDKTLRSSQKLLFVIFFVTMSINMFITGGRAGQVGYLIILTILLFQFFNTNFFKTFFITVVLLSGILFTAYLSSQVFHDRINLIVSDIKEFKTNKNTSVGLRINYAINTLEIIRENPLIGVGTGDFKNSYIEVNMKNTPSALVADHPHNMYLLEMAQFGILGLISLLFILYSQIKFSFTQKDRLRQNVGLALPLLFSIIMLSDCYLLGHYTTMLFVYFSSFLYRPWNAKDQ